MSQSSIDLSWRPLRPADLAQVHALYDGWTEANLLSWRISPEEVQHELDSPGLDLAVDSRAALDPAGRMVAAAWVDLASGEKHRAFTMTLSLPGFEAAEEEAIRWAEARARQRLAAAGEGLPKVIRAWSETTMVDRIERFRSAGYVVDRFFVDMIRPLDEPIPDPVTPPGVDLVDWQDRWERSAWEAHREAFADHWGTVPLSWEKWEHRVTDPQFRPDLSVLAMASGEVVAFALNGVYPYDWEVRGRREGWIDSLGTRREWRRRGLASALISASLLRFAAEGLDHGALGVDVENPTGALGLYTRLGFVENERSVALVKEV